MDPAECMVEDIKLPGIITDDNEFGWKTGDAQGAQKSPLRCNFDMRLLSPGSDVPSELFCQVL
jgi:hypothetical protein